MVPLQILLVGQSVGLMRRIHHPLDRAGHTVCVRTGGPSPMLTLTRNAPDLLILAVGPGFGSLEAWRRAIGTYRSRCQLSVLVISREALDRDHQRFVESVADLGVLVHPFHHRELVQRVDDRFRSDDRSFSLS